MGFVSSIFPVLLNLPVLTYRMITLLVKSLKYVIINDGLRFVDIRIILPENVNKLCHT